MIDLSTPLSTNTLHQRRVQNSNDKITYKIDNEVVTYHGVVKGISSPLKGFKGSRFDFYRNVFKFIVFFPKLGATKFVIPKRGAEFYYQNYGVNEEAYLGLSVEISINGRNSFSTVMKGDISIGDISERKRKQMEYLTENNISNPNKMLVQDTDPFQASTNYNIGAFSGIFNSGAKFLLSHLSKGDKNV